MLAKLGERFTDAFRRNMPDAFVFALILTLITALVAWIWLGTSPLKIIESWYDGFWSLLEFGMQMVLLIVTGYCIALSPIAEKAIQRIVGFIKSPKQVYYLVVFVGFLLSMVSWGWVIITSVLARQLAENIKGIHYPYLVACVYFSMISWVTGLSSSIPLLLNTEGNYLIEEGILTDTIPTILTLGSSLNICMILMLLLVGPLLMRFLAPTTKEGDSLENLLSDTIEADTESIAEEANSYLLPGKPVSDLLNNSKMLQGLIALCGGVYLVLHFGRNGFDLNLNIMIFLFLMMGLVLHKTPMRYSIAMKRASSNVSSILFQFPFYAGIMGIMTFTGLGTELGQALSSVATLDSYPFFSYLLGGIVNFAIPSAGGEYAVIGPSVIDAVQNLEAAGTAIGVQSRIAKSALAIAYGEGLTNLLQPFFLLLIVPIMAKGVKIQARDVMGYLLIPFLFFFVLQLVLVTWVPL